MTATITDYVNYLTDVATQRPVPATPPPIHLGDITPSAFIMDVLRHVGSAHPPQPSAAGGVTHSAHPITRHGVDDMMDIMLMNPVFSPTLAHAADIQEHFAVTFLRQTSAVFQDHWTYIIVPAWNQLANGWMKSQGYGAGVGGAAAAGQ